jgi:hypothetical protein
MSSATTPHLLCAELSRHTMAGVVAFLAILGVAAADHKLSSDRWVAALHPPGCSAAPEQLAPATLPASPPSSAAPAPAVPAPSPTSGNCLSSATDMAAVQEGFNDRVALYIVGLALCVAYICVAVLRSGRLETARVFNNLGIAGVCVLVGTVLAMFWERAGGIELPHITPWLLGGGMIASAAIGRLATVRETPPASLFPWQTAAVLGVTAVLLVTATAYASGPHGCYEPTPDPPSIFGPLALANALLAFVCLASRRWIAALVAIVVTAFAWLVVAAASGAFC